MAKNPTKYTTISIPIPLNNKLKALIEGTGFNSVSSFVVYVLRQIVSEKTDNARYDFSRTEEEKVKERLRNLGYLK